jgi:CubicO group peptidase (beta-lactamase class C family)
MSSEEIQLKLRMGGPEEAGISSPRIDNVRSLAQEWVSEGIHPSLEILAARKGVVFLHEAYGRLGPEKDAPTLELGSIFPIASISKPITATAVMMLVEQGLLGLNRPVVDYLPEFQGEGKDHVLIRHLLTHTSGLNQAKLIEFAEKETGFNQDTFDRWWSGNIESYPLDITG